MSDSSQKIGRWHGAGLLTTTLLGTSVFILPQMTIAQAGGYAMLSWLLLILAILPVAMVFAKLSSLYPHAGGPAFFVEKAFGITAGRTIGMLFLFIVPIGAPAAIIMIYWFIETLFHLDAVWALPIQLAIVGLLFLLNYRGIQVSASLQLGLTLLITILVISLVVVGSLFVSESSFLPTASQPVVIPFDITSVLAAMGLAFWSFLGIEALSHLANDFKDPKRDLIPAIMLGTALVGLIYLGCTYLLIGVTPTQTLAMVDVFDQAFGSYGALVIGALGIAGGIATVNVYTASLSRLTWSMSNDGVLPRYFMGLNRFGIPQNALVVILVIMAVTLIVTHFTTHELEDLIGWVNGVFVLIYLASMLAAIKLLSVRHRPLIYFSCLFCAVIAVGLGTKMLYALALFAIFAPLLWYQQRHLLSKIAKTNP